MRALSNPPRPLLAVIVAGVLLIGFFAVAGATLVSVGRSDDVGYPDGATLLIVREFVRTGHLYLGVHQPPYLVTLYGPLTYVLLSFPHRLAEAIGWSPAVAIRLTLVCGVLCCAGMVFALARRLGAPTPVSWLCVLFALSNPALSWWTTQVRPDFLGLGFSLLSIHLFLRPNQRRPLVAAAACAGIALLIKQSFVAAPAAILVLLAYRRRWREAALWGATVGLIAAGGNLLAWWREPQMLEHLAALRDPVFELRGALILLVQALLAPAAPFAVLGTVAAQRRGDDAEHVVLWYCALAWLVAAVTSLQVGANANYFWEPLFASSVLAGPGAWAVRRKLGTAPAVFGWLSLVVVASLVLVESLGVLRNVHGQWRFRRGNQAAWEALASVASGRKLLSTIPAVTVLGRSPELPDPFLNTTLERRGKWSSAPVAADLEAGRYELIVETGQYETIFSGADSWYRGVEIWSDAMRAALVRAYEPVCRFDGKHLWLPRHLPPDHELLRLCRSASGS